MAGTVLSFLLLVLLFHGAVAFSSPAHFQRSNNVARDRDAASGRSLSRCFAVAESSGPATLDRPVIERTRRDESVEEAVRQRKGMGDEAWEVRIYNDGLNTREHVARSLVQVTGLPELHAYQTMMLAHSNGIAVVGRWVYEIAEMFHDALKKKGIVCDLVPVGGEE